MCSVDLLSGVPIMSHSRLMSPTLQSPPMSSMDSSPQCSTCSTGGTFCLASSSRALRSISTDSSVGQWGTIRPNSEPPNQDLEDPGDSEGGPGVDSPQALLMNVVAMPVFPERPVRPILCTAERGTASGPLPGAGAQPAAQPLSFPQAPTVVLDLLRHVIIDDVLDGREVQALGGYICGH